MKRVLPLSADKKLSIIFRVEPGCLGPQGSAHVSGFCDFAQQECHSLESDYIDWNIVPRNDKSLPEIEFALAGKKISSSQAEKYLILFDKKLDAVEEHLGDRLETLIVRFLSA
jgi:hypothetical protein